MLYWINDSHSSVGIARACIRCATVGSLGLGHTYKSVEEARAAESQSSHCKTCGSRLTELALGPCAGCAVTRLIDPETRRCSACLDGSFTGELPRCPLGPEDNPIACLSDLLNAQYWYCVQRAVEDSQYPRSIPLGGGHNSEELVSRSKQYPHPWNNDSYESTGDQLNLLILVLFQVVFAALALLASLVLHSWTLLIALWALALFVLAIGWEWQKTDYRLYLKFHEAFPRQSRRVHYCGQHDVVFVGGGVKTRPPEKWGELIETETRLEVSGKLPASHPVVAWVARVSLFIELATLPGLLLYWGYATYGVPGIIGLSMVLIVLAIGGYRLYRAR